MTLKPWSADYLSRAVGKALQRTDFERALSLICNAIHIALLAATRQQQLSFGSPAVDALCRDVGARIATSGNRDTSKGARESKPRDVPPLDLFVASELYATGGHTGLLGDYMKNRGRRHCLLALTNFSNRPGEQLAGAWPRLGLEPAQATVCEEQSLEGKCRWLMGLIAERRPQRVFLFTHPHDSPAIAACQPLWGSKYYFIHHVDRLPSLGAFNAEFSHVDVTPFCFACCRDQMGIRDGLYLPVVAPDLGARDFAQPRRDFRELVSAACGSSSKFELDRSDLYGRMVAAILRTTGGRHVHIGDLSKAKLQRLRSALCNQGADPARFLHVPFVPSLWQALEKHRVDLYLGSLPIGGARASVEAMGSATPALWHLSHERSRFHDTQMKYPEAAVWRNMDTLVEITRAIDASWLRQQSAAARRHYEHYHHPDLLGLQLSKAQIASAIPPPSADLPDDPRPVGLEDLTVSWRDKYHMYLVAGRSHWRAAVRRRRRLASPLPMP